MEKGDNPPPYGWSNGNTMQATPAFPPTHVARHAALPAASLAAPPAAPPSYSQAVGGVGPSSPYTPQYHPSSGPAIVTTVVPVGPQPTHMICPSCQAEVNTQTQTKPGAIAYIAGAIILMLGGWLGCCLIPCCIDSCMDVHHSCPNCGAYLGRYRR